MSDMLLKQITDISARIRAFRNVMVALIGEECLYAEEKFRYRAREHAQSLLEEAEWAVKHWAETKLSLDCLDRELSALQSGASSFAEGPEGRETVELDMAAVGFLSHTENRDDRYNRFELTRSWPCTNGRLMQLLIEFDRAETYLRGRGWTGG